MPTLDEHTRVYTPDGEKAHLLHPSTSPNTSVPANCGRSPGFGTLWHGTGSEEEHQVAARRPLCTQCEQHTTQTSNAQEGSKP